MSKELTEALRILTEQAKASKSEPPAERGAAPAVKSAALLGGGVPGGSGADFTLAGAKTIVSSDGLFALVFPDTLKRTMGNAEVTVPVIKKVTTP